MAIWALADLHLSFGTPNKSMEVFGERWEGWTEKVEENWRAKITNDDLVLIAGDISWGKLWEETLPDLLWIDRLPGTKVMIKGNHDYWWTSTNKIRAKLPPSIHLIFNDAFHWGPAAIAGTRLWDYPGLNFDPIVDPLLDAQSVIPETEPPQDIASQEKIYNRELLRLERSLQQLDPDAPLKLAMTHYPPIGADLQPTPATALLEKYGVDCVVFGHIHHVLRGCDAFGTKNGVRYLLTACDFLRCEPLLIQGS